MQDVVEAPPYPGAKPYFLIEEKIEDAEWVSKLIKLTAAEASLPAKKRKKKVAKKKRIIKNRRR
jgi:hypothetical protein